MKRMITSILFILLSFSSFACRSLDSSPKATGYALGVTYLEIQDKLSPDQIVAAEVVYKTLDLVVGENPKASVGLQAAVKIGRVYAISKGASPVVIALSEATLNDLYTRLRERYGFLESDKETQLRILRNLRNGIRQALSDYSSSSPGGLAS